MRLIFSVSSPPFPTVCYLCEVSKSVFPVSRDDKNDRAVSYPGAIFFLNYYSKATGITLESNESLMKAAIPFPCPP